MTVLKTYHLNIQSDIKIFFKACFTALGWEYQPEGRHSDIVHIDDVYMQHGCFWCLYNEDTLIGTVGVHSIDDKKIIEMKRLYILPKFQGKGYGGYLFKVALNYAKQNEFAVMRLDTRQDRTAVCHLISLNKLINIMIMLLRNFIMSLI